MVRIRLRRTGLKNQSTYRIMAADKESPRDGRFLEILGSYNPRTNPTTVEINEERVYDWMSKGAQPSESVIKIFKSVGLMDRYARFKAGESKEALLAEAKAAYEKHAAGAKTEKATGEEKKPASKKGAKEKVEAVVVEAPKAAKEEKKAEAVAEEASKVIEETEKAETSAEEKAKAAKKAEKAEPVSEEAADKVEATPAETVEAEAPAATEEKAE